MTTYETPEKLNRLVETFTRNGIPLRDIAFCIDTAHLHCGGVPLRTYNQARAWFAALQYPETIRLVHLNGNQSTGFADKHAIAFGAHDRIWHGVPYAESGVKAIREFCAARNIDIIMECNWDRERADALALFSCLKRNS